MTGTTWHVATIVAVRPVTTSARALTLSVPGFAGSRPGQHVDLRFTAPDGYQASRAYSLADTGTDERVDLVVDTVPGGEVSPYLVEVARPGDQMELRGPLGRFFVWDPDRPAPVLLVAGGSGVVPLLAMLRARRRAGSTAPFLLVYSVRAPADAMFRDELDDPAPGACARWVFTREVPDGSARPAGRLTAGDLDADGFTPDATPGVFVCGPTGFVEHAATLLTGLGHDPSRVRTERFGGT